MADPAGTRRRLMLPAHLARFNTGRVIAFLSQHRGKLTALCASLVLLPLAEPPATAMGHRPQSATARPGKDISDPEALLVQTLLDIQSNRLEAALKNIDALLVIKPNFRLANLIKGDLLMARSRPLQAIGSPTGAAASTLADFRDEARVRLQHYLDPAPLDLIPEYLLQFDAEQKYGIVVDTNKSRLYLYRNDNGEPRYVTDYYITTGKKGAEKLKEGDQRTPTGVYFVIDNLPKAKLTDFYGPGAFPIDYPNAWDKRLGKDGHGIWLHGVPSDTYSRPPRASNGCVVLANEDLIRLEKYLQIGRTPVIISNDIAWIDRKAWQAQRESLAREVENWRRDWESLNTERYLGHYSHQFVSGKMDLNSWSEQKRAVNASKTALKVGLSNLSVFRYPGNENLVVVTFDQDYRSNNLSNQMRKRQYWMQDGGNWKIVYEGAA